MNLTKKNWIDAINKMKKNYNPQKIWEKNGNTTNTNEDLVVDNQELVSDKERKIT